MKGIFFTLFLVGILALDFQQSTVSDSVRSSVYKAFSYKTFLNKTLRDASHNFVVPGLKQDYVPQGFGETSDWYLITGYYHPYKSSDKRNSMLFIINKSNGKLLKHLILPTDAHVGGVAGSSTDVFVCSSGKSIGRISISLLKKAVSGSSISFDKTYTTKTTCSFASYYHDTLFVGLFDESKKAEAYGYKVNASSLQVLYKYTIPKKVQGFTILGKNKIAVSQSYGRNFNSKLIIYEASNPYKDINLPKQKSKSYVLPPMSEAIFYGSDGNLYGLFESGSNYYYGGPKAKKASYCKHPMDHIIAVPASKL